MPRFPLVCQGCRCTVVACVCQKTKANERSLAPSFSSVWFTWLVLLNERKTWKQKGTHAKCERAVKFLSWAYLSCHTALGLGWWHHNLSDLSISHCSSAIMCTLVFHARSSFSSPRVYFNAEVHKATYLFLRCYQNFAFILQKAQWRRLSLSCIRLIHYCDLQVDSSRKLQEVSTWKPLWHCTLRVAQSREDIVNAAWST